MRLFLELGHPRHGSKCPLESQSCLQPHRKATARRRTDVLTRASEEGTQGLAAIMRRKRAQLSETLKEFSEDDLYNRLGGNEIGELSEQGSEYRFAGLIPQVRFQKGRPVLIFELGKASPATTSADLAHRAQEYEAAGVDALAVPTDIYDTSSGLADLLSVCRAVKCPVLRRDWILHPLQIREAKEAGAAGVMGIVASVLGKHAFILSSYAASLGLDCPVEVVNADELSQMEALDVPFIGCNLGVGLSLALPGFRSDIATGLLDKMAHGRSSMVGATSIEEAIKAKESGADAIFVKKEWLNEALGTKGNPAFPPSAPGRRKESSRAVTPDGRVLEFVRDIQYRLSGDD